MFLQEGAPMHLIDICNAIMSQLILPERTDNKLIKKSLVSSQRLHSSRQLMKGAKSLELHPRLYSTKSISTPKHVASAKTQNINKSEGLEEIAKHYVEVYQRPNTKHTNLKRLLNSMDL